MGPGSVYRRMVLRRGLPADADAIARLIAAFQPELTDDPTGRGAERYLASVSAEAERAYLASERYAYYVAEEADALLGFVAIRDGSHLFHLFVARAHQRRGIARTLWHHARAMNANQAAIAAYTVNSSIVAIPVYRAFGFVPSGPRQQAHGIMFQPMTLDLKMGPGSIST